MINVIVVHLQISILVGFLKKKKIILFIYVVHV